MIAVSWKLLSAQLTLVIYFFITHFHRLIFLYTTFSTTIFSRFLFCVFNKFLFHYICFYRKITHLNDQIDDVKAIITHERAKERHLWPIDLDYLLELLHDHDGCTLHRQHIDYKSSTASILDSISFKYDHRCPVQVYFL